MKMRVVGLLRITSIKKFGASVEGLKYAERLVIFNAPPVGRLQ